MSKPVIIYGLARSGTTWVQTYVKQYNLKNFNFYFIDSYNGSGQEFLTYFEPARFCFYNSSFDLVKQKKFQTLEKKIKFLNQERKKGREYIYKAKTNHVYFCHEWFKEFYKDWHIIKIVRENKWDQFVSWAVQDHNGWDHRVTYNKKITLTQSDINNFLNLYQQDIDIQNETWRYEDLTDNFLENYFDVSIDTNNNFIKRRKSYQKIITNYDEIKKLFDKKVKDVIIRYG